eukprot:SM000008S22206  [mRNA]  locus=s8:445020:447074:+ [translate_table: standard]
MGALSPTLPPLPAAALESLEEASAAAAAASSPGGARLLPRSQDASVTKLLAMDCEMVGVGRDGKRSMLARVAIVNGHGNVVLDKHVQPLELVTDLRTAVSGVQWRHLNKLSAAEDFWEVQSEVAGLLKGRVLVGHALHNDLKALFLSHPKRDTRDTQRYKPLRGWSSFPSPPSPLPRSGARRGHSGTLRRKSSEPQYSKASILPSRMQEQHCTFTSTTDQPGNRASARHPAPPPQAVDCPWHEDRQADTCKLHKEHSSAKTLVNVNEHVQ